MISLFSSFHELEYLFQHFQVSAPLPLFLLANVPSMFYCHFPDKLLCTDRGGIFKQLYRLVIDNFEESSTGCANEIVVNSKFTAGVFADNFHHLGKACQPQVLYPTIELPDMVSKAAAQEAIPYTEGYEYVFASLNRYERKKNISLAIQAFHLLLQALHTNGDTASEDRDRKNPPPRVLLVIAGGFDDRVAENVEHYEELVALATASGINVSDNVVFRRSVSDAERNALLTCATAILYTPANEHFGMVPYRTVPHISTLHSFDSNSPSVCVYACVLLIGIVPLEAMSRNTPVIAVQSGGPLETVVHGETGFLCEEVPASFMAAMHQFILRDGLSARLGLQGREHTKKKFTFEAMVPQLEACMQAAVQRSAGSRTQVQSQSREEIFLRQLMVACSVAIIIIVAVILGIML